MVLYTGVGSINLATIIDRTLIRWLGCTEILAKQSDIEVQHHSHNMSELFHKKLSVDE